jgi:hypothetical protein
MRAHLAVLVAIALSLVGLAAIEARAAPTGSYVAELAAPLETPRQEIVGGRLWKCAGDRCAAPPDGTRPILVCQRVATVFGKLVRFASPAGELSSEELSRCNGAS